MSGVAVPIPVPVKPAGPTVAEILAPQPPLLDNAYIASSHLKHQLHVQSSVAERVARWPPWRRSFRSVVLSSAFELVIFGLIVVNCVTVASDNVVKSKVYRNVVWDIEAAITIIFVLEILLKFVAIGVFFRPGSFFLSRINVFDFVLALVSGYALLQSVAFPHWDFMPDATVTAARAARLLRPLRGLGALRPLRVALDALMLAIRRLVHVALLLVVFILAMGLIALQVFSESLIKRCFEVDSGENTTRAPAPLSGLADVACGGGGLGPLAVGTPPSPHWFNAGAFICPYGTQCRGDENPGWGHIGFDSLYPATITLLTAMTADDWSIGMYRVMDAKGWPVGVAYYLVVVLVGTMFALNLVLATVADGFTQTLQQLRASASRPIPDGRRSSAGSGAGDVQRLMANSGSFGRNSNDSESINTDKVCSGPRVFMRRSFFETRWYKWLVVATAVLVFAGLASVHAGMSSALGSAVQIFSVCMASLYVLEGCLKMVVFGPRTFVSDLQNLLDITVSLLAIVEFAVNGTAGAAVLLSFRLLRVLSFTEKMRSTMTVIGGGMRAAVPLLLLLFLAVFLFGLLGVQILAGKMCGLDTDSEYRLSTTICDNVPPANFDHIGFATRSVLAIAMGDNLRTGTQLGIKAGGVFAGLFYAATYIVVGFLVINLFVALLLYSVRVSAEALRAKQAAQALRDAADPASKAPISGAAAGGGPSGHNVVNTVMVLPMVTLHSASNSESQLALTSPVSQDVLGSDMVLRSLGPTVQRTPQRHSVKGLEANAALEETTLPPPAAPETAGGEAPPPVRHQRKYPSHPRRRGKRRSIATDVTRDAGRHSDLDQPLLPIGEGDGDVAEGVAEAGRSGTSESLTDDGAQFDPMEGDAAAAAAVQFQEIGFDGFEDLPEMSCAQTLCGYVLRWAPYRGTIFIVSLCTAALASTYAPHLPPDMQRWERVFLTDAMLSVVFAIDVILRLVWYGPWTKGPNAARRYGFFQRGWCIFDLVMTLISLCNAHRLVILFPSWLGSTLGALRALRPWSLVGRSPRASLAFRSLCNAVLALRHIAGVSIVVLAIFAVLGTQLFHGKLNACTSGPSGRWGDETYSHSGLYSEAECLAANFTWAPPVRNFDNAAVGMLTLFGMATTDGWQEVWFALGGTRGLSEAPRQANSVFGVVFGAAVMYVMPIFFLNIFMSVLVDSYVSTKEAVEADRRRRSKLLSSATLTPQHRDFVDMYRRALHFVRPPAVPPFTRSSWRWPVRRALRSAWHPRVRLLLGIISVAIQATKFVDAVSAPFKGALPAIDFGFTVLFVLHFGMMLVGQGVLVHIRDRGNWFDMAINAVTLPVTILILAGFTDATVSTLAVLRTGRLFSSLVEIQGIRMLFETLRNAAPSVSAVLIMMTLTLYGFAALGCVFFGHVVRDGNGLNRDANFESVPAALLTLLRVATFDNWQSVMWACQTSPAQGLCDPRIGNCGSYWGAIPFFVCFVILGQWVGLSLVAAILLDSFASSERHDRLAVQLDAVRAFMTAWKRVAAFKRTAADPPPSQQPAASTGTAAAPAARKTQRRASSDAFVLATRDVDAWIPVSSLMVLLHALAPPLGLPRGAPRAAFFGLLRRMDVPVVAGSWVWQGDVFDALLRQRFSLASVDPASPAAVGGDVGGSFIGDGLDLPDRVDAALVRDTRRAFGWAAVPEPSRSSDVEISLVAAAAVVRAQAIFRGALVRIRRRKAGNLTPPPPRFFCADDSGPLTQMKVAESGGASNTNTGLPTSGASLGNAVVSGATNRRLSSGSAPRRKLSSALKLMNDGSADDKARKTVMELAGLMSTDSVSGELPRDAPIQTTPPPEPEAVAFAAEEVDPNLRSGTVESDEI